MTYNMLNWTTTQYITARSQQEKHHKKLVTWYIKFSFKKTLKTDFYIIKWMKRKAANRCRFPLALHMTLHTHTSRTAANIVHNHTFSLFSVSYSSMLHILITRHKNKQTFSLTVGLSTIIIVDNVKGWMIMRQQIWQTTQFLFIPPDLFSCSMSLNRWRAVTGNLTLRTSIKLQW